MFAHTAPLTAETLTMIAGIGVVALIVLVIAAFAWK